MTADSTAHADAPADDAGAVRLTYTMDLADHRAAVRAWLRSRRSSWPLRPGVLAVVEALALAATGVKVLDDGLGALLPAYWLLPLLPLVCVLVPEVMARSMANANAHHGEITATVTEEGVRITSAHADFSGAWSNFGRHLESRDGYLLLSPDKRGNVAYLLPKRALASEADAARLHTLLTTHLPGLARA